MGWCGRRGPAHCLKLAAPGKPDRSQPRRGEHEGPGQRRSLLETDPERLPGAENPQKRKSSKRPPHPQEGSLESAVEPAEQETIKGTAAGEGLHTRERCFAVDPHGLQAHGSHQAPTCWVRTGGRRGRPRAQSSKGPAALAWAPRRGAANAGRLSGPVPARSLGAGRGCSSDVGEAAVKDLKTRHATAAPRRLPRPSYAGAGPAQAPLAPPRALRAPPPDGGPAHAPPPVRGPAAPQTLGLWSCTSSSGSLCNLRGCGSPSRGRSLRGFTTVPSSPARFAGTAA